MQNRESFNAADVEETAARALFRGNPAALLRCAVVIAETGRLPSSAVTRAARAEIAVVRELSPATARDEIELALIRPEAHAALEWLHHVGVLALLLPEVEATVDFSQEAGRRHKDVWEHTKLVVRQAAPRQAVRWAALLHDVAKVQTRTFTADGKVHFHGHAELGARMFDGIARRLAFDRPLRQKVRFLVLHHLRANQYAASWTDSAVRRFGLEMGEHLEDLLDLSRADITSRRPGRRQDLLGQIDELARRLAEIRELDARLPPLPKGLGTSIAERFGIPPSKRIGDLKRELEAAVERGELEERREDEYYLEWLAKSGLVVRE